MKLTTKGRTRIMTLNRVLAWTSAVLGVALAIQVAYAFYLVSLPPEPIRLYASWINLANTLEDGVDQSDDVVVGEVLSVSKGPDIVVAAPGEPSGEDRIPTTRVKVRVEKALKGAPGAELELVQTGQGTDAEIVPPGDVKDQDLKPSHGRSQLIVPSGGDQRATILEDDPPYQVGEKYVLLLKNELGDNDQPTGMKVVLAPEGRYQVTKGNKLKPVTQRRGFAPKWVGRNLADFEKQVEDHVGGGGD